jgi:hypothetical protein
MAEIDPADLQPARLLGRVEALESMVSALLSLMPDNALERFEGAARAIYNEAEAIYRDNDNDPQRDRSGGMHDAITGIWNNVDEMRSELATGDSTPALQPFRAP